MISNTETTRPERLSRFLESLWDRRILPRPDFEALAARSSKVAEMLPPAETQWRRPFDSLLHDLEEEARLNAVGLTFAHAQLDRLLALRERAHILWKEQPAIAEYPIRRPAIIVGQMRSGTTRLQRLLGCDPRFNHTRFHEVMNPLPRRGLDLRVPRSWAELALLNALNPRLRAVHPSSARAVEEAFGLFSFSFFGAQIEAQWRVPRFARHWERADRRWVYAEFLRLLQTIARGRRADARPWVLKSPQFMEDLDLLIDLLPDARLIFLDRDPVQVVGSSASLIWNQMKVQSDVPDKDWIGSEWLRKTAHRARACAAFRSANPELTALDVHYEDMDRDWRAEMRRIYDFLGMELTPGVARRMETYLARAQRSGFRDHSYALADFGLDPANVRNVVGAGAADPI